VKEHTTCNRTSPHGHDLDFRDYRGPESGKNRGRLCGPHRLALSTS
jgi:hypothetical protein